MSDVKITAYLVDGGLMEWTHDDSLLVKLKGLQRGGLQGKQLVHHLLTDDWAAPPRVVVLSSEDADGRRFEIKILYK